MSRTTSGPGVIRRDGPQVWIDRLPMWTNRRCAGCGKRGAGYLTIVPRGAQKTLTFCDPCMGDLHGLLDKAQPEEREGVMWP